MSIDLSSSAKILDYSNRLISHLSDRRLESRGKVWTDHNFSRLRSLFETNPDVVCYHRPRAGTDDKTSEFMWDFLAIQSNGGILLAAESEQNHLDAAGLKHDFEKLLYVFAPVRLLVAKARTKQEAASLALSLAEYAKGSCLHFNPGSAFILHFDLWNHAGSVSYLWQSKGEPTKLEPEEIDFGKPI
jgi:hypothetical protein